ncbi:hypothetical protein P7L78_04575 (plasmid) [Tistrella bauzanensis]|jgi:hypothetical protein|uniref:Big-1 domain-containing protein n=1 Tax=Tistrella arctica TaxID=3133430 RepID=A0ABU9YNY6_9PROT
MSLTVTVLDADGDAVSDLALELLSAGSPVSRATTDGAGRATFPVAQTPPAPLAIRADASTTN